MTTQFHSKLRSIDSGHPLLHNSLGFILSVISLSRDKNDLSHDCDLDECNWMHIYSVADNFLIIPVLYSRIKQKKLDNICPFDFMAALEVIHEAHKERNANYKRILLDAISALNQSEIKPTLLKGAHAILGLGPNPEERFVSDGDLLVLEEEIPMARQALLHAGFTQDTIAHSDTDEINNHQLIPFLYADGSGFIEIHRYPNHAEAYPKLQASWFAKESLLYAEQDDVCFYYNHPWQMLLYNQVHHYHGAIWRFGSIDLRQLAEQSALYATVRDDELLQAQIKNVLGKRASRAYVQFTLLSELFGDNIGEQLTPNTKSITHELEHILGMLLLNPDSMKAQQRHAQMTFIPFALKKGMDIRWVKNHLFNPVWLQRLPQKLRGVFLGGVKLE